MSELTNNFNGKYLSYTYYPGYKINKKQERDHEAQYPYITKLPKSKLDIQIFYNTIDSTIPWGSTYKYTIPKSIDDNIYPSPASISQRQKKFGREFFNASNEIDSMSNNYYVEFYIFIIIIIILLCLILC